jgi:integrase
MMTELGTYSANRAVLRLGALDNRDTRSRIGLFVDWLDATGRGWYAPDLAAYRDHLLERLTPNSTSAHLASIRGYYRRLLVDPVFVDRLYQIAAADPAVTSLADQKAYVDRIAERLRGAIDPANAPLKLTRVRDAADSDALRLTAAQAGDLLRQPALHWRKQRLRALRDTTAFALMLATGVREGELCALEVLDLRQRLGGELALLVRHGKGDVQRLIPYGGMDWVLALADLWLRAAEITEGPVLRGFWNKSETLRAEAMTTKTFERMLASYPIPIDGALRAVRPHDLRRTYARLLYEAWVAGRGGLPLEAIQQNMGHRSIDQTRAYVGTLDAGHRRPGAILSFDFTILRGLE